MTRWADTLTAAVAEMLAEIDSTDLPCNPRGYWREAVQIHTNGLYTYGFDLFKRSVNRYYFQFQPTRADDRQLRNLLA